MITTDCLFCNLAGDRIWMHNDSAIALLDDLPVFPGHTFVIPEDHMGNVTELPENDFNNIWALVARVRKLLIEMYKPDGFDIGINEGTAAGQKIAHLHKSSTTSNLMYWPLPAATFAFRPAQV